MRQGASGTNLNYGRFRLSLQLSFKMFYLIGLGLCDEKDITVRGLEVLYLLPSRFSELNLSQAVKGCTRVYLEAYTSILMIQKERLVSFHRHYDLKFV